MKNTMSLENYGVAALTTREMKTTNGGSLLWGGAKARMVAMANFAVGLMEGLIACNCE